MDHIELTIKVPKLVLVGCGLLLKKQNADPKALPKEELIQSTLASMIGWFDSRGWITLPFPADVDKVYRDLFEELKDEETFHIDLFEAGQRVEDAVAAAHTEKTLADTKRSTEETAVPDVLKPGKANLSKVNRMDVEMLGKLSPKDTLIEKVVKGSVDQVFRYALEIVYTSLPPELWGSPTAEQAINDMIKRHDGAL